MDVDNIKKMSIVEKMWSILTALRNRKLGLLDCCNAAIADCNIDVVGNIEDHKIIFNRENLTMDTTGSYDVVPPFNRLQQRFMLQGLFFCGRINRK